VEEKMISTQLIPFEAVTPKIKVSFWLDAKEVVKLLGIKVRLDRWADWQVIKQFPFGTLAYDYEEGIKLESSMEHLPEVIEFIKDFHFIHKIPILQDFRGRMVPVIDISGCWNKGSEIALADAGLVKHEYSFGLQ
jgi:hypothetical protein